ncbi:MAG: flagellar assembly protein FliX, partial [Asticcacaulis sp.]
MTIKINPVTGMAVPSSSGVRRGGGDFSLSGASESQKSAATAQAAPGMGMFGMDALLAMQGEEDVLTGRRRRQI